MFRKNVRKGERKRTERKAVEHSRRLTMECLESRCMFDGAVDAVVSAGGVLTITGLSGNNNIGLAYGSPTNPNLNDVFTLTSGDSTTGLELNGSSPVTTPITIPGVSGGITIDLNAGGTSTFDFAGPTSAVAPQPVPSLTIMNKAGISTNILDNINISGALNVTAGGLAATCNLTIDNTTVGGATDVDNVNNGGGSTTLIETDGLNSSVTTTDLLGGLTLTNDAGTNSFRTLGTTVFGTLPTVLPPAGPHLTIPAGERAQKPRS